MSAYFRARCETDENWHVEEVWVGGSDAAPLPAQVITHEGVFHADGVTPLAITDEMMRAAGWKKQRRLVTNWEDA